MSRFAAVFCAAGMLSLSVFAQATAPPLESTAPPIITLSPLPERAAQTPDLAPAPGPAEAAPAPAAAPAPEPPSPVLRGLQELYTVDTAETPAETSAGGGEGLFLTGLRTFAWLCVLCAVIIAGGFVVRKYLSRTPLLANPQLGTTLGRIYLNPKTTVHFVRAGGRVLLIGVTPQHIALLTEFDAAAFEDAPARPEAAVRKEEAVTPRGFLAELQAHNNAMKRAPEPEDDDLISLRSDIQRLQQSLQEKMREGQQ